MELKSRLLNGSICLTDLIALAKEKHTAFNKGNNGKIYANVSIWINEKQDDYGNDAGIQLNPKKDSGNAKPYVGNARFVEFQKEQPVTDSDVSGLDDDLPF